MSRREIENLVFEGGSVKGVAHVGALLALEEVKHLSLQQDVKRVAGTSAGAINAALICVGYNANELMHIMFGTAEEGALDFLDFVPEKDIFRLKDAASKTVKSSSTVRNALAGGLFRKTTGAPRATTGGSTATARVTTGLTPGLRVAYKLYNRCGIVKGEAFREFMEFKIETKLNEIYKRAYNQDPEAGQFKYCTFEMLEEFKENLEDNGHEDLASNLKELRVFATNIATREIDEFSLCSTPKVIISDAVRASMAIPYLFCPHTRFYRVVTNDGIERHMENDAKEQHLYVDGGVGLNFPIRAFDPKLVEGESYTVNRSTLGFSLMNSKDMHYHQTGEYEASDNTVMQHNLLSYTAAVWDCFSGSEMRQLAATPADKERTVYIENCGVGTFDFELSDQKKVELLNSGRRSVYDYLNRSDEYTPLESVVPAAVSVTVAS